VRIMSAQFNNCSLLCTRRPHNGMETIGSKTLWSFLPDSMGAKSCSCTLLRKLSEHEVQSFLELATKIAELQFKNRDYVLLFRGQTKAYKNFQHNTTLKPSLFRDESGRNPSSDALIQRFQTLHNAERILAEFYSQRGFAGQQWVTRHQIVRWAILQHYEVCPTPLLDVTQSLRIAASFATNEDANEAFIFVVGVPNLSGAITASAEAGLQIVRLSSVCPPSALRPHIQEGYLLGEYPQMVDYQQKELYRHYEIDFGLRLVAKFRFNPQTFWRTDDFPKVSKRALYPSSTDDPLCEMADDIKRELNRIS
jgi:hypothetical protein